LGEAISKEVISELEAALRETELKPETINSIIGSLKLRRRRRVVVRSASVVVAVAALCAVFYLGTMVGKRRVVQSVSSPEPQVTKEPPSQPEATLPPALTPEVLDVVSEKKSEKIPEKIPEKISVVPAASPAAPKEAGPPVIQRPKAAVIKAASLYAVELIGFSGPKESAGLNKKLSRQGYSSSLNKIVAPDGTVLHRVWIGHFKTPEKARKFVTKLRRNEGLEGKIVERTE